MTNVHGLSRGTPIGDTTEHKMKSAVTLRECKLMVRLLIATALLPLVSHQSARAGAFSIPPSGPKQRSATVPASPTSQPRAVSPSSQSQVNAPGSLQTAATNQHHESFQKLTGTTNISVPIDLGKPNLGGKVYSTGTEDIILTVLTPIGTDETRTVFVNGQKLRLPNPNISATINYIYMLSPGSERFIASNRQFGRQVNLGTFPPGEVIFGIKTSCYGFFRTGDGTRNPDHLPHAIIRTFRAGPIEVWFEDLPRNLAESDFNDAVFQLTGGISDTNTVGELLKTIKEDKGEPRDAAIKALRQVNPKAAAMAVPLR
jgi:hypothetical protein